MILFLEEIKINNKKKCWLGIIQMIDSKRMTRDRENASINHPDASFYFTWLGGDLCSGRKTMSLLNSGRWITCHVSSSASARPCDMKMRQRPGRVDP